MVESKYKIVFVSVSLSSYILLNFLTMEAKILPPRVKCHETESRISGVGHEVKDDILQKFLGIGGPGEP